jgi:GntR family transcriptional regulator / MocR family aminotransferase
VSEPWSISGIDLHLDTAPTRRRATLEASLRDAITSGRLESGARLPATRVLAVDLGVSRGTVSAAYDQLVSEGYLVARQGDGTRVAPLRVDTPPHDVLRAPAQVCRYDLRPGTPDVSSFPPPRWLRASRRALQASAISAFSQLEPAGRPELRAAIAAYLARTRGVSARTENVVVTAGATHAIALICAVLRETGTTTVAMEDPGYAFHRGVVERAGLRIVPLAVDEDGARTEDLTVMPDVGAVILTASHQYPTDVVLTAPRRRQLTMWASSTRALIVEDDYDGEFRYDRKPVGAVQGTAPNHTAYMGTTSKSLGPGIRLGWAVLPNHLVAGVTEAVRHTVYGIDAVTQLTLAELITSHEYDRYMRALRLQYRRRREQLQATLSTPALTRAGYRTSSPLAGLQALVRLPDGGPNEDEIIALAKTRDIELEGLAKYWHEPAAAHPQGLVIGFAQPDERSYPLALRRLGAVLRLAV